MNVRRSGAVNLVVFGVVLVSVGALALAQSRGGDEPPASAPAGAPQAAAPEPGEPPTPAQPSPEEVIRELKRTREQLATITPTEPESDFPGIVDPQAAPISPNAVLDPLMPEGTYVIDRAGRLVRSGSWYAFDMEGSGQVVRTQAMRILPSKLLESMERASAGGAEDVTFNITAEVTEFHGRNYLLLRKVLIQRRLGNLEGGAAN